jgi:hypothetical protein
MQLDDWLSGAKQDVLKRQLPELVPLLEGLAVSTRALRSADETARAEPGPGAAPTPRER